MLLKTWIELERTAVEQLGGGGDGNDVLEADLYETSMFFCHGSCRLLWLN
jgi:hypothetical protein